VGTVKARLFRARQRLRQMLAPYVATLDQRSRSLALRGTSAGAQ
jgi:hypothetical protein